MNHDIHLDYLKYKFKHEYFRYVVSCREKIWQFVTGAKPPEKRQKCLTVQPAMSKKSGRENPSQHGRSTGLGNCLKKKAWFASIVLMSTYLKIKMSLLKVARLLGSTLYENMKPVNYICTQLRC